MKRIDLLITEARQLTDNVDFSDAVGISDEQFLRWANDAQERIQSLILQTHPSVFQKEKEISVTAGQEEYSVPSDAFLGVRVEKVEYSSTGNSRDYYTLPQGTLNERFTGTPGGPSFYIRRSNKILIQPKPQSGGSIRVTYQFALPRLDIRRGKVASATLTDSEISALALDTTVEIDSTPITDYGYMSVVNKDGTVQMQAIPVSEIDINTGAVTLDGSFSFQSGETIAANNWVLTGPYSTTHSQLPDVCEKYLLAYMIWKAHHRDSSNDSAEQNQELAAMEEEITNSFAEADFDVDRVTILNADYLNTEWY